MKYYTTSKLIEEELSYFFHNNIERVSLKNIFKIIFSTVKMVTVVSFSDKNSSQLSKKLQKYSNVKFLTLDKACIQTIGNQKNDHHLWGAFLHEIPYYHKQSSIENALSSTTSIDSSKLKLTNFLNSDVFITNEIFSSTNINKNSVLFIDEDAEELTRKHENNFDYNYTSIFSEIIKKNNPSTTIYVLNPSKHNYDFPNVVPLLNTPNPNFLFPYFDNIYTVNSLLGVYAIIGGHNLTCFSTPFYSGWGLTTDASPEQPKRPIQHTIESFFNCVFIQETKYFHPGTSNEISLHETCELINKFKKHHIKFHRDIFFIGISAWKRKFMSSYFASVFEGNHFFSTTQQFIHNFNDFPHSSPIIIHWGVRIDPEFKKFCDNNNLQISIVEDGFIRSKGLGSNLTTPFSIVYDELGIYFDARTPSTLEHMLQNYDLTKEETNKAHELFNFFKQSNISKYNHLQKQTFYFPTDVKKILVLGQVEDDASIQFGCSYSIDNMTLLQRVRTLEPKSFIIYKPHPDIVAKNRTGQVPFTSAKAYCDVIISDSDIFSLIDVADCIHTITSLSGFESLIRGKEVVCHGMPFYSGWGLTRNLDTDSPAFPRRTRNRTIEEMFYITYVLYPIYFNHNTNHLFEMKDLVKLILSPDLPNKKSDNSVLLFFLNIKRFVIRTFLNPKKKKKQTKFNDITCIIPSEELLNKNLLFLQGPIGPFFKNVQQELTSRFNSNCHQVIFNGGDLFFSFFKRIFFFGTENTFPSFISDVYLTKKIDKIFLLGDCRILHKTAIEIAHKLNIDVYVFEEGYFRPNFITLEKNGVNANSSESINPDDYEHLNLFDLYEKNKKKLISPVGKTRTKMNIMATKYYLFMLLFKPIFLSWNHHKSTSLILYSYYFLRGKLVSKRKTASTDLLISSQITNELANKYFLLPLQLKSDFQITEHSSFKDINEVIDTTILSFSKFSNKEHHIIIKLHPMDIGTSDYSEFILKTAEKYLVNKDRIHYIIDVNLPMLLKHTLGVIVVNSTVGISALHHNKPTITLGKSNYNMTGITHQDGLDLFWTKPIPPIPELFLKYKLYIINKNQINGSFYV